MKMTVLLTAVLSVLYICWKSLEPLPQAMLYPAQAIKRAAVTPAEPALPVQVAAPRKSVAELREELAHVDHELARAGYPEVMLDARLSESEREELISKVLYSTDLFDRIVRLKTAK
jgi:hypothetical protein